MIPELGGKPARATLTIVSGDQWTRTMYLRNGEAGGAPIDLTGATITAEIRKTLTGPVEVAPAVAITDAVNGCVTIDLTEAACAKLSVEGYEGDKRGEHWLVIRMVDAQQRMRTLVNVSMRVMP